MAELRNRPRWRQAQHQHDALRLLQNTARQTHGHLGFPTPPDDYWDDDPDHYPPGWQLSWLIHDGPVDDLLLRLEDEGRPPRWRYWRATRWLGHKLYVLGLVHGGSYAADRYGAYVSSLGRPVGTRGWDGKRKLPPYLLGWPTGKWRCLLRYRHWPYWPDGRPVVLGHCGRCVPWPCCGSIERDHAEGCTDV